MVEFIIGPAGTGKTTCMFGKIKKRCTQAEKLCCIVPEQFSQNFDKKLYHFIGAHSFNEIVSLSFTGLARQLFQLYGDPNRKGIFADEMSKMILTYQAIDIALSRPEALSSFRRQSLQSGFAEDIINLIRDMKRMGISPDMLLERSRFLDMKLMDKTNDIAAIYIEYQRLMKEYGFKDELDNIREAASVASLNGYFTGKTVYLDEFESFTADQYEMIRCMISSADNVCITLRTDNVNEGEYTLFEIVNDSYHKILQICRELNKETKITVCEKNYRFASADLEYISVNAVRNSGYDPFKAPKAENISIFEARDMYNEAEYVCATIKHLIYEDKELRYSDIAIISNDIAAYTDVLKAALKRYDIPYFLSIEKSADHTAVMVFFLTLMDILCSRKFRSEQIFRLIKSGLLDITLNDASLLENYCYKWCVDGDMWKSPFTAADNELEKLEAIRKVVIEPVAALKEKLRKSSTASDICGLLYDYLIECHAERNTSQLMRKLIENNKDYEASELKRLWGCLIEILDSINDTLGSREVPFSDAAKIIRSMVGRIQYSVPPQKLDAVTVASARMARLDSPKVVFIMGANDGDFPNQINVHGLFSQADRSKLAENGIELSTPISELIAAERLVVYKAISAASHKLFISYSLSDLGGQAKYPARIVDSIISLFNDETIRRKDSDVPVDYYAVTLHSAFYHYMQEIGTSDTLIASIRSVLMDSPEYRQRLFYVFERSNMRHDYNIDKSIMEKLQCFEPFKLSSTGLEEYNLCHFKYFCDKCLRLHINEKIQLDARIAGELSHNCFYGILGSRSKADFLNMSYSDIKEEINKCSEEYRSSELSGDFGKDPKFQLIFNKLTERMSEVFMYTQQSLMVSDFTPHDFELDLRRSHSVVLPFGDDKQLSFGGVIDRADICKINDRDYLRIIDYKSSRKKITAETLANGINMQMLLYLFASTDKGGIYEGYEPAGVLYSPVRISDVGLENSKIDCKNSNAVKQALRTNGLVLGDTDILEAMEKGVNGEFIPVKFDKNGVPDRYSECISAEGMTLLRKYTYSKLIDMAESLYSGNVDAVPLVLNGVKPCSYCNYSNICGNSESDSSRTCSDTEIAEAEEILNKKYNREEEK